MNDLLKCGAKRKFTVIKNEDINPEANWYLGFAMGYIEQERKKKGKSLYNEYLVINTDEPYINEIIEILKRNNHWG